MALPELVTKTDQITMINAFQGLNKNLYIGETEFSEMKNITNDYFPVLANRKKRGIIRKLENPQGIIGGRYLGYVADNKLYYDESYVCDLEATNEERQLVMMGAYLCVFPDGLIYNTQTHETSFVQNQTRATNVQISLCKLDGTLYNANNTVVSSTEPTDKTKYWLDTSGQQCILKMYSTSYSMWTTVATTYVKFEAPGIGVGFKEYDAVRFQGVDGGNWLYNGYNFNQTNIVYACDENTLIVVGLINLSHTNADEIIFTREKPQLDFVCEKDNRLWGCSSENHEIYACKQGDPTNWNFFGGLDSDSYAVTVGTQNIFTGVVSYSGYVFFFKEDGYHKIYGNKPSNYEVQWKGGRGVQQGSSKSIAIVDDYLFFKAKDGVCVYDGSITTVSDNLGIEPYYDAVGEGYRHKYYLSMRDEGYNWNLYVYDVTKRTWVREDSTQVKYIAYANNGLYFIDYDNDLKVVNNDKILFTIFPEDSSLGELYLYPNETFYPNYVERGTLEDTIEWSFATGDLCSDNPYNKYIKKINLRLLLEEQSKMKIEIMYDASDEWENVMELYCTKKRSYELPIPVKRCDRFRLRFSGFGEMRLFSMAKAVEGGSGV